MSVVTASESIAGYRHEAYVYRGERGFLEATVPFVRAAIEADEPILVAVIEPRLRLVQAALGADAGRVTFVNMADIGRNPARIIPAWLTFLAEAGSPHRAVRGIGEPIWAGRSDAELIECQLHEALLNRAVHADTDFWLRCPYDADALDAAVIAEALRSHPLADLAHNDAGARRGLAASEHFAGHDESVSTIFGASLPEPPADARLVVFDADRLWQVRQEVRARLLGSGARSERIEDVVLAVHELATNSIRHGKGVGRLRAWRSGDAVVIEVADSGSIVDPMVGRVAPALEQTGGRGVWLANQLCDLVQIRSGAHGTTVRVSVSLA
jgi:anti-sigma regulatory factor (Ser/Thr protein kinase)